MSQARFGYYSMIEEKNIQDDGLRFQFGSNWQSFLNTVDEIRIEEAKSALEQALGPGLLSGRSFLDVGAGSGLSSLAARRLGARVVSFDYDPESINCVRYLKQHFGEPNDTDWRLIEGSILDRTFLSKLGTFDVVHAWGVLHHTGQMFQAMENITPLIEEGGYLFLSIYNDQGIWSRIWHAIKKLYCTHGLFRVLLPIAIYPVMGFRSMVAGMLRNGNPLHEFQQYKHYRGMSIVHDWKDWIGGYPFETARPEEVFTFYKRRGMTLTWLSTTNAMGTNRFVFKNIANPTDAKQLK